MWFNSPNKVYFIAECGQNHNGSVKIAKQMIDIAAMPVFDHFSGKMLPGIDAVKFCKRDLNEEFTDEMANQSYSSPHSFGSTYLEHRKVLELSVDQHRELEQYAHSKGLDFIETLCSPSCIDILGKVEVDVVKIASRDVTNIPLLQKIGGSGIPVMVSSGMSSLKELELAVKILLGIPKQLAILHCVSEYPAHCENLNLRSILFLKEQFPNYSIGYSDHSVGIMIPSAAVALGATIIEKHITLNRTMKGSDQGGSLGPEGLWRTVRDIRNLEKSLGRKTKEISPAVLSWKKRLARSLALLVPLSRGQIVLKDHFCMRSPGIGLSWDERRLVIGKMAKRNIPANSLVKKDDFE